MKLWEVAGLARSHVSPKTPSHLQKEAMRRREMGSKVAANYVARLRSTPSQHDSLWTLGPRGSSVLPAKRFKAHLRPFIAIGCGGLGILVSPQPNVVSPLRPRLPTEEARIGLFDLGLTDLMSVVFAHSIAQPASTTNSRLAPA